MQKVVVASLFSLAVADECSISNGDKIDCGYSGMTESECLQKGCCYVPVSHLTTTGTPWCYYKAGATGSCFVLQTSLQEPFSDSEVETFQTNFFKNINIDSKGGVVAAPDYDTPGGSYYYHWMRDGDISPFKV
jgi:glucoamylase